MPEKIISATDGILQGSFPIPKEPPYHPGYYFPSDAANVVESSFINKDPRLMVTDLMHMLNMPDYQSGITDFLLTKAGDNPLKKDVAAAMAIGQILHAIELETLRIAFHQQRMEEARATAERAQSSKYARIAKALPELPPFEELELVIKNSTSTLEQLQKEREALEQEREEAIQNFAEAFQSMQTKLETELQHTFEQDPESLEQFREDFTTLSEQMQSEAIRGVMDQSQAKTLAKRVQARDIYLRWKAEEITQKQKEGQTLTASDTKLLETIQKEGLLDSQGEVRRPPTKAEKELFVKLKEEGIPTRPLTIDERAQYERYKATKRVTAELETPKEQASRDNFRSAAQGLLAEIRFVGLLRHSLKGKAGASVQATTAVINKTGLGRTFVAESDKFQEALITISEKQKEIAERAESLQERVETTASTLASTMQNAHLSEYTEKTKEICKTADITAQATEQAATARPEAGG